MERTGASGETPAGDPWSRILRQRLESLARAGVTQLPRPVPASPLPVASPTASGAAVSQSTGSSPVAVAPTVVARDVERSVPPERTTPATPAAESRPAAAPAAGTRGPLSSPPGRPVPPSPAARGGASRDVDPNQLLDELAAEAVEPDWEATSMARTRKDQGSGTAGRSAGSGAAGSSRSATPPAKQPAKPAAAKQPPVEKSGASRPAASGSRPAAGPPVKRSASQKRELLGSLCDQVRGCRLCPELVKNRTQTVFGVGNVQTRLVFLGEAPGADEDKKGEPFVGRAGQLLDKIIEACSLRREDIYILNTIKCRPPENRTPLPEEMDNCRPFFEQQLEIIRPEFICCLGKTAATALFGPKVALAQLRGKVHVWNGMRVVVTYHPAYLLRNPAAKKDAWEDMQLLMRDMRIEIPGKPSRGK